MDQILRDWFVIINAIIIDDTVVLIDWIMV